MYSDFLDLAILVNTWCSLLSSSSWFIQSGIQLVCGVMYWTFFINSNVICFIFDLAKALQEWQLFQLFKGLFFLFDDFGMIKLTDIWILDWINTWTLLCFSILFILIRDFSICNRCFMVLTMMFSGFKEIFTSMLSTYLTQERWIIRCNFFFDSIFATTVFRDHSWSLLEYYISMYMNHN